jgi:DNA-binding NtrC family response regulator
VEDKSFQQMTEEFARIVIPKVWEREGRKVSRVAQKLSISPKKVRRILQLAGVTGAAPEAASAASETIDRNASSSYASSGRNSLK